MSSIAVFALAAFLAAPVPKAGSVEEAKKAFQGEWTITEFVEDGNAKDMKDFPKARALVKGDAMALRLLPECDDRLTFTLGPKTEPACIDALEDDDHGGEPGHLKGIYKLETDKVTLCWGLDNKTRPKTFESGPGVLLLVLERVRK
jgi:uncharacterized protein (TIGR03067 family)